MKLCGGSSKNMFSEEMNIDTFLSQAEELEKEKQRGRASGRMYETMSSGLATHPAPLLRATEIMKWSRSAEYNGLLARAVAAPK